MKHADLLVEIYTEELPPKHLLKLILAFRDALQAALLKAELKEFDRCDYFVTPRRLAILIKNLQDKQPEQIIYRKGPTVTAAYDAQGKPTPALIGFARSCGVSPEELNVQETSQGKWVTYQQKVPGQTTKDLLPGLLEQALFSLPIPKRMSWGKGETTFVRPVHAVLLLYDHHVIEVMLLGCQTGKITYGHRFLAPQPIQLSAPSEYEKALEKAYVIADFAKRKQMIIEKSKACLQKALDENAQVLFIDDAFIDEITGLVEWPVPLLGHFDAKFLNLPQEILISAMHNHQRYFPVTDREGKLLPYFILISNIQSHHPKQVIAGNERVLHARLADAAFFYEVDKKQTLSDRLEKLDKIIFQAKLGTLFDKTQRVINLSKWLAEKLNFNPVQAECAARWSKVDLTTQVVSEFPELQGIMGYYYALYSGEAKEIAQALKEQYLPRMAGDNLPTSFLGCLLALADRIDTLTGIFSIEEIPTGDKDPYGLRRAAFGVLRILIERQLDLNLQEAFEFAIHCYPKKIASPQLISKLMHFVQERLRSWYLEQGIEADIFAASAAVSVTHPLDLHKRIQALRDFKSSHAAQALSIANKRVSQILTKYTESIAAKKINPQFFETMEEQKLAEQLELKMHLLPALQKTGDYKTILLHLSELRQPIDDFFDHVLVMTEDKSKRENRLLLLSQLRHLFLQVADIALLQ